MTQLIIKPKRFTKALIIKRFRQLWAFIRNTFVTDCPACHKHFYGFHPYKLQVVINTRNYRIVCHRCGEEAKQLDHTG